MGPKCLQWLSAYPSKEIVKKKKRVIRRFAFHSSVSQAPSQYYLKGLDVQPDSLGVKSNGGFVTQAPLLFYRKSR